MVVAAAAARRRVSRVAGSLAARVRRRRPRSAARLSVATATCRRAIRPQGRGGRAAKAAAPGQQERSSKFVYFYYRLLEIPTRISDLRLRTSKPVSADRRGSRRGRIAGRRILCTRQAERAAALPCCAGAAPPYQHGGGGVTVVLVQPRRRQGV
jgi:hypothetical protein